VTDPKVWLRERLAQAPPVLRARVDAALDAARAAGSGRAAFSVQRAANPPLDVELRAVAEDLLAQAQAGPPTHETALTLLAADALITLACEWAGGGGVT
jgi:hypothetical protein